MNLGLNPVSFLVSPNVILPIISAVIFCMHLLHHQTPQRQILNPRQETKIQLSREIKNKEKQAYKMNTLHLRFKLNINNLLAPTD